MSIADHRQLRIYRDAFKLAAEVYGHAKSFPQSEQYRLTDQIIRSSRSPCASFAEAWRKRRYPAHFVSKMLEAEAELAETQVWLEFAVALDFIEPQMGTSLDKRYSALIASVVNTRMTAKYWTNFKTGTDRQ